MCPSRDVLEAIVNEWALFLNVKSCMWHDFLSSSIFHCLPRVRIEEPHLCLFHYLFRLQFSEMWCCTVQCKGTSVQKNMCTKLCDVPSLITILILWRYNEWSRFIQNVGKNLADYKESHGIACSFVLCRSWKEVKRIHLLGYTDGTVWCKIRFAYWVTVCSQC
jgi:hypothetical protein